MPKRKIRLDPKNARIHPERNLSLIRRSLDEVGPFRSIAIDRDYVVRAGNGVAQQAMDLGLKVRVVDADKDELIAVRRADLHGKQAQRAALLDNRTGELSEWNEALLGEIAQHDAELLSELFDERELRALRNLTEQSVDELGPTPAEIAEGLAKNKWKVEIGQLWRIPSLSQPGENNYLYIGDCRGVRESPDTSCIGCFTSPPYAEQRDKTYASIPVEQYVAWWEAVQETVKNCLNPNGSFFLNLKPHCVEGERVLYVHDLVLAMKREWGWRFVDELCWVKAGYPGVVGKRFRNAFEPIFHFTRNFDYPFYGEEVEVDHAVHGRLAFENLRRQQIETPTLHEYFSDSAQHSNVLQISVDPTRLEIVGGHPARFPPKLVEFFLKAYSQVGERWLDPFAGSGTLGIACEAAGRLSFQVEFLPKFAAVILERFQQTFGCEPELVSAPSAAAARPRKK